MTLNRLILARSCAVTAVLLMLTAPAWAQQGSSGADWRYISGDAGGTKYSPLVQIDASNVSQAEDRVALEVGELRTASGLQPGSNAAGDQREAVLLRRERNARRSPLTAPRARPSGPIAWTKANAATALHATTIAAWRTGPTKPGTGVSC